MSWTTPRTWTTGELVTAAIMNTHIRDNLNATAVGVSTTKGDLAPATAGSTLARLGVGGDGNVLIADSACSVGMRWGGMLAACVLNADAASINITGIPAIYKTLILYAQFRSTVAGTADNACMRFNGDNSACAYDYVHAEAPTTGWAFTASIGSTKGLAFSVTGGTAPASRFTPFHMVVPDYSASGPFKSYRGSHGLIIGAANAQIYVGEVNGIWRSASSVSSMSFGLVTGCLAASSTFYLWGQ